MSKNTVTTSRVIDIRKPITSRTGVDRATKARDTLATAQAILLASGQDLLADALTSQIERLNREIVVYYHHHHRREV